MQALGNALGAGKGQGACLPVDMRVLFVKPGEPEDDLAMCQTGDIQGKCFSMGPLGSDMGGVKTSNRTGSGRAAIDELDWDRGRVRMG